MATILHIESITQLTDSYRSEKPAHPLIAVIDLSKVAIDEEMSQIRLVTDMYAVFYKSKTTGDVTYGRRMIDFQEGSLYGCAPGQTLATSTPASVGDLGGWALYFHPDLLRGYTLADKIARYGFFDYEVNEALHLSDQEKDTLNDLVNKIKQEYETNIDEYSNDLLVSSIELLLNYIKRYYGRQFLTRKPQDSDLLTRYEKMVKEYINSEDIELNGLPTVQEMAAKLNLSPSYLSDLLKKETGKNAQEHIHFHLIEKAKYLLLNRHDSVAEIAYSLGFEHPPYFSRLFKKKTGYSPSTFRATIN